VGGGGIGEKLGCRPKVRKGGGASGREAFGLIRGHCFERGGAKREGSGRRCCSGKMTWGGYLQLGKILETQKKQSEDEKKLVTGGRGMEPTAGTTHAI